MDFSLREWLIVLGVLVIAGVLFDGYRRMQRNRRGSLKLAIDKNLKFSEDDRVDYFNGELPKGGARVVRRGSQDDIPLNGGHDADDEMPDPLFTDDLGSATDDRVEPVFNDETLVAEAPAAEVEAAPTPEPQSELKQPEPAKADQDDHFQEVEEVIVLNVFAKQEGGFQGAELMRLVLACGMRFGNMDIFHRHQDETGKGAIQFSMANAVKPGIFDLDNMDHFATPAVTFFMSLPGPDDIMQAFDFMLETANCVVKNLDGELRDEMHSVMTKQTVEHCRQKIRDFERRQLSLLS